MERFEKERLEKEAREMQQRLAVQQHFDTSLRIANQKVIISNCTLFADARIAMQRIAEGFNPHPFVKIANTPVSSHSMALSSNVVAKRCDKDKSSSAIDTHNLAEAKYQRDHEKWISQQRALSAHPPLQPPSPSLQRQNKLSAVENPHLESYVRKPSSSPVNNVNQSPKLGVPRANSEQNFSLYGYQPFQHSYITPAQLKENSKVKSSVVHASGHSTNFSPLVAQRSMVNTSRMTPVYGEKREPSPLMDRSVTPGSRNSTVIGRPPSLSPKQFHPKVSQERISPHLYQTHVGAFKPYENQALSAPPAHQSSSPGLTGSRGGTPLPISSPMLPTPNHMSQEQPQNLVKSEAKNRQQPQHQSLNSAMSRQHFSSAMIQHLPEQRHSVPSHRTTASPTYSLMQGLIPNTNFTTAATTSHQTSIISSISTHPRMPFTTSLAQQAPGYPLPTTTLDRNPQAAGITRGLPYNRPTVTPNINECQPKNSEIAQPKVNHFDGHQRVFNQELVIHRTTPSLSDLSRKPPIVATPRVVVAPVHSPYGPPPGRGLPVNMQSSVVPMSSPPAAHSGVVALDLHNKRRSPVDAAVSKRSKKDEPLLPTAAHSVNTVHKMDDVSELVSCKPETVINSDEHQNTQKKNGVSVSDATLEKISSDNDTTQSSVSSVLTTDSSSPKFHPKLKKAWLQRHSDEDKVELNSNVASVSVKSMPSHCVNKANIQIKEENNKEEPINGSMNVKDNKEEAKDDEETSSASEAEPVEKSSVSKDNKKTARKRAINAGKEKESKRQKRNSTECETDEELTNKKEDKKKRGKEKEGKSNQKRGRKPKSIKKEAKDSKDTKDSKKKSLNNQIEKPSLSHLKKTGQPFLQNGPCCDVAPKLPRCRECKPTQRNKKIANIFCRFYWYRKIRFNKSAVITSAGFSEPKDAESSDLRLWLPPENPKTSLTVEQCKFLISHVGDQFCDLVKQEQQALKLHVGEDKTVTWKRVVQGVREMCDVCETTLFNIHWVCQKCGFVICIDCYKARKENSVKEEANPQKERDKYQWLLCANRQPHEQDKLVMTQIIAGNALCEVGELLHKVRKEWNIPFSCSCVSDTHKNSNGISQHLITAVSKCFKENEGQMPNGVKDKRSALVNGVTPALKGDSENNTLTGYSSESGSSPLSWLADVALNSSRKLGTSNNSTDDDKDSPKDVDGEDESHYSTLRELLIRPTNNKNGKETKVDTTKKIAEESVTGERQTKSDTGEVKEKIDEKALQYFTRRYVPIRNSDGLPSRTCTLEETKKKYPNVAHSWYCNGRLLALCDPKQKQNLPLFQEQWRRGQAVLVQNVHKHINTGLWNADEFNRNLGDTKNDLVNCKTGIVLPKIAMKKFWDGFESLSKRMKDEDNDYLLLKLKDWPPGDDFSDILPDHFSDLMKNLPLAQYTDRNGPFNLAGRLPECFVRPDLGPKTYIAYGSPNNPDKGTTNLHLDISDAVNVMMYVGTLKGQKGDDYFQKCLKAIDDGGCDELMKKRVREKNVKIGALWHIYDARDADKIRDLLNKVAQERGETLAPHHDPIHDQSWYLDDHLRRRLHEEYGVDGYAIAQCLGDAVFIPAGAPHQVRNLQSCIKIANDFVSPENVAQCFNLTQEFRQLSDTHMNHEDKLQIKNIIYHAVKDALASLSNTDNQDTE
ncbi:putative JmjC domain-containing histone demethylation protein 2C-like protein [Leptotrombidium deliense]|uniref:[histone H3]-dimethyl-L-lysine(9) demethylase n=1 Tax=Leptotrombidium deliense TaxID=299467 RepID=A0A443SQ76_9ACAR|nr:putative JmjC domain-containing histone demethylation protein 2C-like protein [Leptotrombidium deliense]